MEVGPHLRTARARKRNRVQEVAVALGKSSASIKAYEYDVRHISAKNLFKLCAFYGISVDEMVPPENYLTD
jgi:transcriptional regulator with XRE-family HTH domain